MKVFRKVYSLNGHEALIAATDAVVEQLVLIQGPRSLCEIKVDEEDYLWLCNWAYQLTPWQLRRWLEGANSRKVALQSRGLHLSYAEAAGCLLLLLASESARRTASEGVVWPSVRDQFAEGPGSILFVQGHPKPAFKVAIEAAARKLDLRHVFGIEGTQNYYLSVYLQFGFTQKGMERLAHWLAGQPSTEAIMYLLGVRELQMESRSFVRLWDALRNYRRNNIGESQVRRILADNPWVLADWADELLRQARRHPDLGTASEEEARSDEQVSPQFLEEPRLQWNWPEAPVFSSALVNLADFDLIAERYQVRVGAKALTTLIAADDGVYSSNPEDGFSLPEKPKLVASLIDDNGDAQASQLLELWNQEEDVELFDLQRGVRFDAYTRQRQPNRAYGLLTSLDLAVEPPDLHFHDIGSDSDAKRLYLLPSNNEQAVRVTLIGEEIWNSSIDGGTPPKKPAPEWSKTLRVSILPSDRIRLDRYDESYARISGIENDVELLYVRLGGRPLDFELGDDGDYLTVGFDITQGMASWDSLARPQIKFKIGLRRGSEQAFVEHTKILNVSGVLRASIDGWQVVKREDKLAVQDAKQIPYKVFLPGAGQDADRLALLEGPIFLKRLWRRPSPLGQLGGYGASLELRPPYNFTNFKIVVSAEVHDPGIFERAPDNDSTKIRFYLRLPLEPGRGHMIVLWKIGEPPVMLDALGNVEHRGCEWDIPIHGGSFGDGFVALAYQGARIGSWWPANPPLSDVNSSNAKETAALLKWMHAPIVSPSWLRSVQALAQGYPAQLLASWLLDEGLPSGLTDTATEEQWKSSVRQAFAGWVPDGETVCEIITALGGASADDAVSEALHALFSEDPLLMGRVASVWLESPDVPFPRSPAAKRKLIDRMRFLLAGLSPGSNDLRSRENEMLKQVAGLMKVDENFVKRGIVQRVLTSLDYNALPTIDRYNVETALSTAPFREYLGLRILSSLL